MAHTHFCILEVASGWIVGRMTDAGPELHTLDVILDASEGWAERAIQLLNSLGYTGEGVVLGLASPHCLSRSMAVEHTSLARDRQALAYALEAWFPLAAEDLVTDFAVDGDDVLGVAVQTAVVVPLVKALEDRGVAVQAICPVAMLALQHHLTGHAKWGRHLVAWGDGDQLDLWLVDGRQPRQWRLLPADPASVVREIQVMTLADNTFQADAPADKRTPGDPSPRIQLAAYETHGELIQVLSELPSIEFTETESVTRATAAAFSANEILVGHREPWIDFRRGALAPQDPYRAVRSAVRFTTSAAMLATILFVIAFFVRAERYERETRQFQADQLQLFQQCLPGQVVPVGIRSRLESEHTKLAGLTGESNALPVAADSLTTLYNLLTSLPEDLPFRLMELRVDKGRVHMEWEVSSHGDANRIASTLQERGFDVEPPHSQLLADGSISLRMDAVRGSVSPRREPQPES